MKIFWTVEALKKFAAKMWKQGYDQCRDTRISMVKNETSLIVPLPDVPNWMTLNRDMANELLGAARIMTQPAPTKYKLSDFVTPGEDVNLKAVIQKAFSGQSRIFDHIPPTEKEMGEMSARAEKWWLEQKRLEKTKVSTYEFKYKLILTRKALLQFAQEHRNNGHNFGFDRGVEAYRQWSEKKHRQEIFELRCLADNWQSAYRDTTSLVSKLQQKIDSERQSKAQPYKPLHFRVFCEGKERQVRIYLGDPVTLCEITSKNSVSFGYTKRNPKDQWNTRVAVMESLKNALTAFGYEHESREIIYRKLLAKYPELKG